MESYYMNMKVDYTTLLEQLKTEDIGVQFQAIDQLRNSLSVAMENTLTGFPCDPTITQLVEMLKAPDIMDLSNEIKFMAIQCLFVLMDIYPQKIQFMVNKGLVQQMCETMQQTLGYVDLSVECIKAFEKISQETPYPVLQSQALQLCLNMFDFFDYNTQGKVLQVFLNVTRHCANENDVEAYLLPCLPVICSMVDINVESDQQKVQKISEIIFGMCQSFTRILSPVDHFERVGALYEKVSNAGGVESILRCLQTYSFWIQAQTRKQDGGDDFVGASIDTSGNQKTTYTDQTISNFLLILKFSCQYSQQTVMQLVSGGILDILETLIPVDDNNGEHVSTEVVYVSDALSLLNSLFPSSNSETVIEIGAGQKLHSSTPDEQINPRFELYKDASKKLEDEKKMFLMSLDESIMKFIAEKLVPKIFAIYSRNISQNVRINCLNIIDKILAMIPDKNLQSSLNPVTFSKFIQMIFTSGNGQQVLLSLKMMQKVLSSDALAFAVPFLREGIRFNVDDLAKQATVEKFNAEKPAGFEQQPPPGSSYTGFGAGPGGMTAFLNQANASKMAFMKQHTQNEIDKLESRMQEMKEMMQSQGNEKKVSEIDSILQRYKQQVTVLSEKQKVMQAAMEQAEGKDVQIEEAVAEAKTEQAEAKQDIKGTLGFKIMHEAQELKLKYLDNKDYEKNVEDSFPEELGLMDKFKELARSIQDEAAQPQFNFKKSKELIEKFAEYLISAQGMTSFEFSHSGLLSAIELYLTKSSSQVKREVDLLRSADKDEEVKQAQDDMKLHSHMSASASKEISKNEATSLILRLKTFTHIMTTKVNGKMPFRQLITQCQDFLGHNENLIFKEISQEGYHGQVEALRQLNKNTVINLVYDPEGKHMAGESARKAVTEDETAKLIAKTEALIKDEDEEMVDEDMTSPALIGKAKSMALPFGHLQATPQTQKEEQMEAEKSKLFRKRHKLFDELKQIPLNLQQCDNIWLLEDFLLKRIRSLDDVNRLVKSTRGVYGGGGLFGAPSKFQAKDEMLDEEPEAFSNPAMQSCFQNCLERIADLVEGAVDQSTFREMAPEFVEELAGIIEGTIDESDVGEKDIKSFWQQLQAETDLMVSEHSLGAGSGDEEDMAALDEHLQNEESRDLIIQTIQAKLMEFHTFIDDIKSVVKEKQFENQLVTGAKKEAEEAEDKEMEEEQKSVELVMEPIAKELKDDEPLSKKSPQVKVLPGELPQIEGDSPALAESGNVSELEDSSAMKQEEEDVEMTDEQLKISGQVSGQSVEMTDEQLSHNLASSSEQEKDFQLQVPVPQKIQQKPADEASKSEKTKEVPSKPVNMTLIKEEILSELKDEENYMKFDLEELIRDNNGEDIDIEFYHNGKPIELNTSIYEIVKSDEPAKPSPFGKPLPKGTSPGQHFRDLMSSIQGEGGYMHPGVRTIYFQIKEKPKQVNPRKDSLADFAQQRARTRSQVVNDISPSSLNLIVQQLIEKEFQVFTNASMRMAAKQEGENRRESQNNSENGFENLERCLKVLKVMNFVYKNVQLLTNQGINFLLLKSNSEKELKDFSFSEIDLQIALTHDLSPLIFHHNKLNSNLLKAIQDPLKLVSGGISDILKQIFCSCSFLFPFETKQLYFKLVSFIGVDINRSLYFLRDYMEKSGKGRTDRPDDRSLAALFGGGREEGKKQKIVKQKCKIDRERILEEATQIMTKLQKRAFLEIEYKNEEGTGHGPTLEFYSLIADKLRTANGGNLWRQNLPDGSLFPKPFGPSNEQSSEVKQVCELFQLAGTFVAKSITDDRLIDLPISQVMWDLLLGKKMNLFDLKKIDEQLFQLFSEFQVMANRKKEIDEMVLEPEIRTRLLSSIKSSKGTSVQDYGLFFYHPNDDSIELIKDGKDLAVTPDNLQEYIDLVLHSTFHETVRLQMQAFKKGFNFVLPIETLRPFDSFEEVQSLICGVESDEEWKDTSRLKEAIITAHGYHSKSRAFLDFLRYLTELDSDQRKQFMRWICGCSKLPIGGFAALHPHLTVVMKKPENPDATLPSVMTCQNYVKMPEYSNYETLKARFDFAISEGSNNFTLS